MLVSGKSHKIQTIEDLERKFEKLDDKYGYFMSYDSDYHKTRHRLNMYLKSLEAERDIRINQDDDGKRNILVL